MRDPYQALSTLRHSAHISPILMEAVDAVEAELHRLRDGYVEVEGAEVCTVHLDGVMLETGEGRCDMAGKDDDCIGAPLYRASSSDSSSGAAE